MNVSGFTRHFSLVQLFRNIILLGRFGFLLSTRLVLFHQTSNIIIFLLRRPRNSLFIAPSVHRPSTRRGDARFGIPRIMINNIADYAVRLLSARNKFILKRYMVNFASLGHLFLLDNCVHLLLSCCGPLRVQNVGAAGNVGLDAYKPLVVLCLHLVHLSAGEALIELLTLIRVIGCLILFPFE